ncbi:hypothetical protein Nepgr_033596 [Nepenthes gracilis]|uniref:Uncharacterized protein n=1 Tax=Nepenthes gracilis TaxID=150966 RepID=A0AAD3Y6Q7_NEPGR|nr:hypothetical protein Nepgr_033596 [Nepenthes gracilis]
MSLAYSTDSILDLEKYGGQERLAHPCNEGWVSIEGPTSRAQDKDHGWRAGGRIVDNRTILHSKPRDAADALGIE